MSGYYARAGVQLTHRDREVLAWLCVVGIADVTSVATMLAAVAGARDPLGPRAAQHWIGRMRRAELVDSCRPNFRQEQMLWATRAAGAKRLPNPFSANSVHELEVARQTALLALADGASISGDAQAGTRDARADAVFTLSDGRSWLLEVELSVKTPARLDAKVRSQVQRWADGDFAGTLYRASPAAARAVRSAVGRVLAIEHRPRLLVQQIEVSR